MFYKKYKTGLVLSGGSARGFAHLGALKALEESGIFPDIISGTSAGAIVGAFYADGYKPEEILEILTHKKIFEYFRITLPKTGLFRVAGLIEILKKNLRSKTFDKLSIPLIVTVTNLSKGIPEYFHSGELVDILVASASIPVIIEARKINGDLYADGGVMDNLPVGPLLNKCRKMVGVHANPVIKMSNLKGLMHLAERSFHLAIATEVERKKSLFDYYIEPQKLGNYGLFDIRKGSEIFRIGYEATRKVLSNSG